MTLTPICEISTLPKHILTDINLKIILKTYSDTTLMLSDLMCNLINIWSRQLILRLDLKVPISGLYQHVAPFFCQLF